MAESRVVRPGQTRQAFLFNMMNVFINRMLLLLSAVLIFLAVSDFLFAQDNQIKRVTAQSGDGIHTLLLRHGLDPIIHTPDFIELNRDALGQNDMLFTGRTYTLPPTKSGNGSSGSDSSSRIVDYPVFGEDYSRVSIRDDRLEGAIYYLIAGHGGPDPGAITQYGNRTISEHEYAYDVTLRLARRLIEHNATVYLIVQSDDGIRDESVLPMNNNQVVYPNHPIPRNQLLRLKQRTDAVNNLYARYGQAYQRMVSIHIDSRSRGQNIDVFFYHHRNSSGGLRLAENIHQSFRQKYAQHQPNRRYDGTVTPRSNLYVIRNTLPPAVLIELGNLQNTRDQPRFIMSSNRQALANWIADGMIMDYEERQ